MFRTIRAKLLLMVAAILLITALVIIYFTNRDVGREVMRIEENNASNILDSAYLNVQGVYQGLLSDRVSSIQETKERLKRETSMVFAALELYFQGGDETSVRQQQQTFVDWIQGLETGTTGFFIADSKRRIIFDSHGSMAGKNIAELEDIKGQPLTRSINTPTASYHQYAVFSLRAAARGSQAQMLGYIMEFPGWDWIVGSFVDISYVEAAEQARLEKLIQGLEEQFSQARVAESGTIFVFNRGNEVVVRPESLDNFPGVADTFPRLADAAETGNPVLVAPGEEQLIGYSRYFRPLNWYLSVLIPRQEIQAPARDLVRGQSMIIGAIFLAGALAALLLVRHISRPLGILAGEAKEMGSRDLTAEDSDSEAIERLTRKYHDEVGDLAGSFLFMQEELRKNVRRLVETTAAKERYASELNMASEIQMSMVPKTFPAFPEIREFDIYALLESAREVGGDLYDFFMLDDDQLCFTVGDVSDKGMPAALYMAITRTLVQSHAGKDSSPAAIMTKVNNDLSRDNPKSMFVTMIVGILNIRTGRVRYANAGHNLPVVIHSSGECSFVQGISGPVAGAMEGIDYKELSLDLGPGDGLFLYTDGVTEAMNPDKVLFSDERLLEDVCGAGSTDPREMVGIIRDRVRDFARDAPQSDDITMLMLRLNKT